MQDKEEEDRFNAELGKELNVSMAADNIRAQLHLSVSVYNTKKKMQRNSNRGQNIKYL